MSSRPSLILVHGAWHGPECWHEYLVPLLETQGFKCITPTLQYSNADTPLPSIKTDIDQVAELVLAEVSQGIDVVVVNHSLGGYVGCSAIRGFTKKDSSRLQDGFGSVIGLVHIVAFLPQTGKALMDVSAIRFYKSQPDGWATIPREEARSRFYHDLPREEQDHWLDAMTPQSDYTLEGPGGREGVYAGWMDVPLWFLVCKLDPSVPPDKQIAMLSAASEESTDFTLGEVDAGHSPFLSKPEETVKFIVKAVDALSRDRKQKIWLSSI